MKDYRIRKETQANGREWFYVEIHQRMSAKAAPPGTDYIKEGVGYQTIEGVKQAIMNKRASNLANSQARIVSIEIIEY